MTCESKGWQGVSMDSKIDSATSKSSSSSGDEWAFERDLSVTEDFQGPADNTPLPLPSFMSEIVLSKPRKSPNDCCSDRLGSISPPGLQSGDPLVNVSSTPLAGAPGVALPHLTSVNPSSSTHAGGILKKVKSVRFEDVICNPDASPLVTPTQKFSAVVKRPSPLRNSFTALSLAAGDDTGIKTRPMGDQVPAIMNSRIFKSKLVPKGTMLKSRCVSEMPILKRVDTNVHHEIPPGPGLNSKSTTSTLGRNNHVANNENGRVALTQGHARRPWSTMREEDRKIEKGGATPKHRHSTPLRNIFKFK